MSRNLNFGRLEPSAQDTADNDSHYFTWAVDIEEQSDHLASRETGRGWSISVPGTYSVTSNSGFELSMTDELRTVVASEFGTTRKNIEAFIAGVLLDPHGDSSIDAFKDTDAGQTARVVHRVGGELADLVPGKSLAVKGTGMDVMSALRMGLGSRSSLNKQFFDTLDLSRKQQQYAPDGIGGVLFINEVYGLLRYRDERNKVVEWMLMECIEDAEPIENGYLCMSNGGMQPSFSRAENPELAAITDTGVKQFEKRTHISFKDLEESIYDTLDIPHYNAALKDLNGNNVLKQATDQGNRYTIIDIG